MIFYSNGYSVTERSQCEKRIHRTGQKLPVFYHDLVMSETIDNDIFDSLKEGKDVVLSIVDPELMRRLKRETKP
jgi:SNF2 family DNA or RNA helicase